MGYVSEGSYTERCWKALQLKEEKLRARADENTSIYYSAHTKTRFIILCNTGSTYL